MRTTKSVLKVISTRLLRGEIKELKEGCGKKVDHNGDCAYYGPSGALRLCSTCSRNLKLVLEELKNRKQK